MPPNMPRPSNLILGKWYRVVERTPDRLILNPYGIDEPGVECAYVHKLGTSISEEEASRHAPLAAKYDEMVTYNKQVDRENASIDFTHRHPRKQLVAFKIDTEDGQSRFYWHHKDAPTGYVLKYNKLTAAFGNYILLPVT